MTAPSIVPGLAEHVGGLIARGAVYDLGQPLEPTMLHNPIHPPFTFGLVKRHGDIVDANGISASSEIFSMGGHVGTHFDGLGHISADGKLHGGHVAKDNQSIRDGVRVLGMETVPPVVRRGVLLDIAGARGVDVLGADVDIGADELAAVAARQGTTIGKGDVVLLRTGWIRHWSDHHTMLGHHGGAPGIDLPAARWLVERGAAVIGADNGQVEAHRSPSIPVHRYLIVESGIHIMELLNLEELAKDRVTAFLFVALPLKIVGATGSPIRPVAIA